MDGMNPMLSHDRRKRSPSELSRLEDGHGITLLT